MGDIKLEAVESSNISAIGFDVESGTLHVKFNNGGMYNAEGATQADYDTWKSAKSKGVHFNKILKQSFAWKKTEKKG